VDAEVKSDKPTEFLEEGPDRLADVLQVIRKRLWLITLMAIIFGGLAMGYSLAQTPVYEASVKILVAKQPGAAPDEGLSSEVQGLQQLTLTVIELINSRPVAKAVVKELNLQTTPGDLLQSLSVEQVEATSVVEISYQDPSPQRAQQVVNAIGEEVSKRAYEGDFVSQNIIVSVWERPTLPRDPVNPDLARNIGVGVFVGVMLGVGLAFLLEYFQPRRKH
jgi:capsular polysaccharide biosynthesis protein